MGVYDRVKAAVGYTYGIDNARQDVRNTFEAALAGKKSDVQLEKDLVSFAEKLAKNPETTAKHAEAFKNEIAAQAEKLKDGLSKKIEKAKEKQKDLTARNDLLTKTEGEVKVVATAHQQRKDELKDLEGKIKDLERGL